MHDLFISYSHEDRDHAAALAKACEAAGWSIWWDRDLVAGKLWDKSIENALNEARVVVLLWSRSAGRSRWVRAESEEAANRENLVPTLLDDERLPLGLRPLQAVDLRRWREGHPDEELTDLLRKIGERLQSPARDLDATDAERWRARAHSVRRRIRIARTAVLVGLFTFLLYGAGLLDGFLGWDTRFRAISIGSRGIVSGAATPREELTAVVVEPRTPPDAPFGRADRLDSAEVLDRLSAAGARVVVFDVLVPPPDPLTPTSDAGTLALARAVEKARSRGTAVVFPVSRSIGSGFDVEEPIFRALQREADGWAIGSWGTACIGHNEGFTWVLPLLFEVQDAGEEPTLHPSLALRTLEAYRGEDADYRRSDGQIFSDAGSGELRPIHISAWETVRRQQKCEIMGTNSESARLLIDLGGSGLTPWSDRLRYEAVRSGEFDPASVHGKIALVGVETPADLKNVRLRGHVYGYQLHAAAIATLLEGTVLRALGPWAHLAILLLFSSLAAALRLRLARRRRGLYRLGIASLLLSALALAIGLAVGLGILMDVGYVLLAIMLANVFVGRLRDAA
jgi:hypothetical protein